MEHSQEIATTWLTAEEIAKHLRIATGTVRNWAAAGIIPSHHIRRTLRFDLAEIEEWARDEAHHDGGVEVGGAHL
ncbi:MAG: helix-turn-helix domain-containing protein [Planctomycetota bacterium]|nr:helix-turn-helix domain-containing protein [Planctomycetota bacterium]